MATPSAQLSTLIAADGIESMAYILESLTIHGWSDDPCLLGWAGDGNVFDSIDAAQAALRELQALWPDSTLRIREVAES